MSLWPKNILAQWNIVKHIPACTKGFCWPLISSPATFDIWLVLEGDFVSETSAKNKCQPSLENDYCQHHQTQGRMTRLIAYLAFVKLFSFQMDVYVCRIETEWSSFWVQNRFLMPVNRSAISGCFAMHPGPLLSVARSWWLDFGQ